MRKTASSPDFDNDVLSAPTPRDLLAQQSVVTSATTAAAARANVTSSNNNTVHHHSDTSLNMTTTTTDVGAAAAVKQTADGAKDAGSVTALSLSDTNLPVAGGMALTSSHAGAPAARATSVTVMEQKSMASSSSRRHDDSVVRSAPASPPLTGATNSALSLTTAAAGASKPGSQSADGTGAGTYSPSSSTSQYHRPRGYTLSSLNDEQRGPCVNVLLHV